MLNTDEKLLTFAQAAAWLPSRPHVATLHRWRLKGVHGVRLETVRIGGRRYTSQEAISRFVAATTAAADGSPPPARTARQRERAIREAEKELNPKKKTP